MSVVIVRPVLALVVADDIIERCLLPKGMRFHVQAGYDIAGGKDWLALDDGGVLAIPASAWKCEKYGD